MDLVYIISWVVTSIVSAPCPYSGKYSDLGILNSSSTSCAVYHTQTVHNKHEKTFTHRDSATAFLSRLKSYNTAGRSYGEDKIESVKIDSLKN